MSNDPDVRAVTNRRSATSRTVRVTPIGIAKPDPTIATTADGVEWQPRLSANRVV